MAKATILVADDDRVVVELLALGLGARGFKVTAAADGMQVIMMARRTPPEAILLDVMMPGGTGFDVLKRLRSNAATARIPVVAMSASMDPGLSKKVQELGANAFVLKPLKLDDVAATLRQLLEQAAVAAAALDS